MFDRDDLARRLETLIDEIDMIKWSEVSPQNRSLPDHACDTIVSITGNWVAFDTEAWETQMEDNMYLIPDEWGAKAFDYPRGALTGLIDRRAEEKRTTRPARAGDESGVPQRFRLLELEAPAGLEVREAPQPQEEAPLRFPNAKAQRRLARTLDLFMVKAGVKPLITDYGYPEGPRPLRLSILRCRLACKPGATSTIFGGPSALGLSGLGVRLGRDICIYGSGRRA